MSQFNLSPWFDLVADHNDNDTVAALLTITDKYPVRENLLRLRELTHKVDLPEIQKALLLTIDAILDGHQTVKKEFGLRFHRYPRCPGCVSACGELFSLLRQALTYPKD